jgi:NAD(P)-dependent dehydrogenase (short-subunit alcohol dehydrogenase family)
MFGTSAGTTFSSERGSVVSLLKDRSIIVTGAGQGIGREYALALAAEGAAVTVAEIVEENGRKVVEEIAGAGLPT